MEFLIQLIFWIAVCITIYFIGYNHKLRKPRNLLIASLLAMVFITIGLYGKSLQLWELENGSAFNFMFWFPGYLLSYYFMRKMHLRQTGNEPILIYASRYNIERTVEAADVLFSLLVLTVPTILVILLGNVLV